jgi:hypothetical protein
VRQDHRIGGAGPEILHHLFHRHDGALGGQHRLLLHPDDAFEQHVAGPVGP